MRFLRNLGAQATLFWGLLLPCAARKDGWRATRRSRRRWIRIKDEDYPCRQQVSRILAGREAKLETMDGHCVSGDYNPPRGDGGCTGRYPAAQADVYRPPEVAPPRHERQTKKDHADGCQSEACHNSTSDSRESGSSLRTVRLSVVRYRDSRVLSRSIAAAFLFGGCPASRNGIHRPTSWSAGA